MTEKTLSNEIKKIVKTYANNNPPPEICTVKRIIENEYCDIVLNETTLHNINFLGELKIGSYAILLYLNGNIKKPLVVGLNAKNYDDDITEILQKINDIEDEIDDMDTDYTQRLNHIEEMIGDISEFVNK